MSRNFFILGLYQQCSNSSMKVFLQHDDSMLSGRILDWVVTLTDADNTPHDNDEQRENFGHGEDRLDLGHVLHVDTVEGHQ